MTDKLPIMLVHGAWHGAWCWDLVAPLLEQAGHPVLAPDLPGHGQDSLPLRAVNFNRYVEALCSALASLQDPVILVGHSMAGMLVSAVSEAMPEAIHTLMFVNAYIPRSNDSVFSLMQELLPGSDIARAMVLAEDKRSYSLSNADVLNLFYPETGQGLQEQALSRIQAQASLPLHTAVKLTDNGFGRVRRVALCSAHDRVIPPRLQRRMLQRQPCHEFVQVEGDHSLFYSAPQEVAAIISAQT